MYVILETSILFYILIFFFCIVYFVVVSLLFNIFLGIYIQHKFKQFRVRTTTEPDEGHTGAPNPRENIVPRRENIVPRRDNIVPRENIVPDPRRNVDEENIPESFKARVINLLRMAREKRINSEQEVLPVRRDIRELRPRRNL